MGNERHLVLVKRLKTIGISGILAVLVSFPAFSQRLPLESWVENSTIKGAKIPPSSNAARVAGGVDMKHYPKWSWAYQVEDKSGVLVVHPVDRKKPAVIKVKTGMLKRGAKILFVARGSDTEPGVKFSVKAGRNEVKSVILGRQWQNIEIGASALPVGISEVEITVSPIGWKNEFCFIDVVQVE